MTELKLWPLLFFFNNKSSQKVFVLITSPFPSQTPIWETATVV